VNHWDSYMDDPFFYEQSYDVEERTEGGMERGENNIPPAMSMPDPSYPFLPAQGYYPAADWHHPVADGVTPFVDHDDVDSRDVAPPTMTFDTEERVPMEGNENINFPAAAPIQAPPTAEMPGVVSGAGGPAVPPMLPMTWMVPSVPFPACSPIMPFGAPMAPVYYAPVSYYGGASPYVPLFPGSCVSYR